MELAEVSERWHALLPPAWSLRRDVSAQIADFADGILEYCTHSPIPSPATTKLRYLLEEGLGAGLTLNRDVVLAQIASLRASALPPELARLTFVVQSTFYKLGVESHQDCALYPGAFAMFADRVSTRLGKLQLPPVDWDAHPSRVSRRLTVLGIDLEQLLALPATELANVACSRNGGSFVI